MIQERKVKLKAIRRSPKGTATVPFKDETLRVTNSKKVQSQTEKVQSASIKGPAIGPEPLLNPLKNPSLNTGCAEAQPAQTQQARNGTEADPSQRKPSGGQANGSAEGSRPFALPSSLSSVEAIVLPVAAAEPRQGCASAPAQAIDTPSLEKPLQEARRLSRIASP
jgi:hypothetical protein